MRSERRRPHVLVVDRDPAARRLLERALYHYYEVDTAADAIRAVSVARRFDPDVVLLDYSLPAGAAPLVVERLHSFPELAAVPVILVSAWDDAWSWEELLEMDAAFVPKPVEPRGLLDEIEHALAAA